MNNLTGQKFGKLKVLYRIPPVHGTKLWACRCDCGNPEIQTVREYYLTHNRVKSCGCLRKEVNKITAFNRRSKNTVEFNENDAKVYNNKGDFTLIDIEDWNKIKDYYWSLKSGYWYNKQLNTSLHRFLMMPNDNEEVDHINRDKNDNRKENLRIVLHFQNTKNRSRQYNNKSGYTGVCFDNTKHKWRARITVNNKVIYLGYYKQLEDAVRVRKEAEIKYYGDFAPKENKYEKDNL